MSANATDPDPFCEQRYWRSRGVAPSVAEPVGVVTGFAMLALALVPNIILHSSNIILHSPSAIPLPRSPSVIPPPRIPALFYLCKATLAVVGAGTMLFHGLSDANASDWHVSDSMFDWVPIVLMTNAVMALYLSHLVSLGELAGTLLFALLCAWSATLIVLIDSNTRAYFSARAGQANGQDAYGTVLNVLLLVPLCLTLLYAARTRFPPHPDTRYLWAAIAVSVACWVANAHACAATPQLFILHDVYHITIAYAFIFAACLGVCLDDARWEFRGVRNLWPEIAPRAPTAPPLMKIQLVR